jgi:hypothetical protein
MAWLERSKWSQGVKPTPRCAVPVAAASSKYVDLWILTVSVLIADKYKASTEYFAHLLWFQIYSVCPDRLAVYV